MYMYIAFPHFAIAYHIFSHTNAMHIKRTHFTLMHAFVMFV